MTDNELKLELARLMDNSYDIGTVSGVLQGIALTPYLLPNQKDAIARARVAIAAIQERNLEGIKHLSALQQIVNKNV